MKFGHLLKEFGQEAEVPPDALLNYKKLKKLIKAHQQHKEEADGKPAPAAAVTAASADGTGGSSEEEEAARSASPGSAPAAAAAAQDGPAGDVAAAGAPAAAGDAAAAPGGAVQQDAAHGVAEEDREFIQTLNEDLSRINSYFMEREEEAVIRLRALQDARADAGGPDHLDRLRSEMVDFHGELVLLLHWSLVNYAAVAKILKKHDKLTGSRLRAPVLASVLHQPFLSTESISQLVKEAERDVQELTSLCGGGASGPDAGAGEGSAEAGRPDMEAEVLGGAGSHVAIYKRTRAALHMLSDMQERASTPSTLLPPSTAQSDAAPDGKKLRTTQPAQPAVQQQEQSPVEVEAH